MIERNSSSEVWQAGSAPIAEIDILWLTAGLGCDGDTIAVTAATQPSIEDITARPGRVTTTASFTR
jgi:hypothetical protein